MLILTTKITCHNEDLLYSSFVQRCNTTISSSRVSYRFEMDYASSLRSESNIFRGLSNEQRKKIHILIPFRDAGGDSYFQLEDYSICPQNYQLKKKPSRQAKYYIFHKMPIVMFSNKLISDCDLYIT